MTCDDDVCVCVCVYFIWKMSTQVEDMDSCETAEASSSLASSFRNSSCDLLSHTLRQPVTLLPHVHEQRGRLNLSDRKLSLQEHSQTTAAPCDSPGLSGRYIYPSLPYSPITSPHTSPCLPRRPTVESHSVSITDLQVESWEKAVCQFGSTSQGLFHLWVPHSQCTIIVCLAFVL